MTKFENTVFLLALFWFAWWWFFKVIDLQENSKLRREVRKFMSTADQAVADLTGVFQDLATQQRRIATDLDAILTKIQQANGVDPGVVETLSQTGRSLVTELSASADKVEAVLNPPAPAPPANPGT